MARSRGDRTTKRIPKFDDIVDYLTSNYDSIEVNTTKHLFTRLGQRRGMTVRQLKEFGLLKGRKMTLKINNQNLTILEGHPKNRLEFEVHLGGLGRVVIVRDNEKADFVAVTFLPAAGWL